MIEGGLGMEYRFADHLCTALNLVPSLAIAFFHYMPGVWSLLATWMQGSRSYTGMRAALGPVGWGIEALAWMAQRMPVLNRQAGLADQTAIQN